MLLRFKRPQFSRGIFSALDKYKLSNEINAAYGAMKEEDITRFRELSDNLLSDPICDVSSQDAEKHFLPTVEYTDSLYDRARWAMKGREDGTTRLYKLTIERLENRRLQDALGIGPSFNHQLFWMMLHAWLLHKRMVQFNDGAQEEDYFEALFRIIDQWMLDKEVPRHRLTVEIGNAQKHALGFCVAMDIAIEREDIIGGKIHDTLLQSFHEAKIKADDEKLVRLTKYTLRQAAFALHIPKPNFLQGKFYWIDMPVKTESIEAMHKPKQKAFINPKP